MARAARLALGFTLAQVALALLVAPHTGSLRDAYLRLNQWDSLHYAEIAENGYHLPPGGAREAMDVHTGKANVAFFPAYPLLVQALTHGTGISVWVSLLLISQLFCWVFWLYFFLLLQEFKLPSRDHLKVGFSVAVYPAAFFLAAGYSESLFLAALLGFIYWMERALSARSFEALLSGLHGFFLTASRLVGIPLAIYPLLRKGGKGGVAAFLALTGGAVFFLYCQIQFGSWDLYLKLQILGWGNQPDYLAIFYPSSYIPRFFFEDTVTSMSRLSVPVCMALFIWVFFQEKKQNWKKIRERLDLYGVAFLIFYISLSGKANANMDSMIRYTFPVIVVLALCLARLEKRFLEEKPKVFWAWVLISVAIQIWMTFLFTRGRWVA